MKGRYLTLLALVLTSGCGAEFVTEPGGDGGAGAPIGGGGTGAATVGGGDITGGTGPGGVATGGASSGGMSSGGGALGPFGPAMPIAALNDGSAAEDDPTLTASMLEIYFDSNRPGGPGGSDIWTATRPDTQSSWSAPVPVDALSSTDAETSPEISGDGLTIYFSSTRSGSNGQEIYVATRAALGEPWSSPSIVSDVNTASNDWAAILVDPLTLVFNSNEPGHTDMFQVTRPSVDGPWEGLTSLSVNTAADDADPWIDSSGTLFYFGSDRDGSFDLFVAMRANPEDPWGTPAPVSELNSAGFESDPWLSPDAMTIYFARDDELYMATR